jgi:heme-degrading monooxygenase HmoA
MQEREERRSSDGGHLLVVRCDGPNAVPDPRCRFVRESSRRRRAAIGEDAAPSRWGPTRVGGKLPRQADESGGEMANYFWVTTRTIKPGSREQFEQAWRPAEFPPGLVRAYVLYAEDGDEVVGISIWDSADACEHYRDSDVEARREARMDPFVLEQRSSFYSGRELSIPGR